MLSEIKDHQAQKHKEHMPLEKIEQSLDVANGVLKTFSSNEEGKAKSCEIYNRKRAEIKDEFVNRHKDNAINAYRTHLPELSQYLDAENINIDFKDNQEQFKCCANRESNVIIVRIKEDISSVKSIDEINESKAVLTGIPDSSLGLQMENILQHELGHYIWSPDNLLKENSNFNSLFNDVTSEVLPDNKNMVFGEFARQNITNSAFSDLGEGFSISMELILLEKEIKDGGDFSKDEVARYLELRKDRFLNENLSTSSSLEEKDITVYDGISVIYRIYKDYEVTGKGGKAVADFIKHCDVEKLISIKKFEEGHYIKRELPSKEEIVEKTKEQEKLFGRKLTKEEKIKFGQELNNESLERQINEYETMIGRKLTEKEISSFTYNGIIGNELTEEYKEFVKMGGKEIMSKFLYF